MEDTTIIETIIAAVTHVTHAVRKTAAAVITTHDITIIMAHGGAVDY